MNLLKKYILLHFNIVKMLKVGGDKNYYLLTNLFITWILKIMFVYAFFVVNNYEFACYILFYSVLFVALNLLARKFVIKYTRSYFYVGIFLMCHLLGGLAHIGGDRLYDYFIFGFIRYDWPMHFLGGLLGVNISNDILEKYFSMKGLRLLYVFLVVMFACGMGVFNELFEFFAVVFLNAATAVGDYTNNMLDLLNNFLGASFGAIFIYRRLK